jgi:hypothetical protein
MCADQVDELIGRFDRVGADAQRAGEHVGRPAGHHGHRRHLLHGKRSRLAQ